jgi:hypothetical protein
MGSSHRGFSGVALQPTGRNNQMATETSELNKAHPQPTRQPQETARKRARKKQTGSQGKKNRTAGKASISRPTGQTDSQGQQGRPTDHTNRTDRPRKGGYGEDRQNKESVFFAERASRKDKGKINFFLRRRRNLYLIAGHTCEIPGKKSHKKNCRLYKQNLYCTHTHHNNNRPAHTFLPVMELLIL